MLSYVVKIQIYDAYRYIRSNRIALVRFAGSDFDIPPQTEHSGSRTIYFTPLFHKRISENSGILGSSAVLFLKIYP